MALMHQMLSFYNATPERSVNYEILRIMFQHLSELPNLSIEKMAELCMTSTASISRLVRNLGFRNYSFFRTMIQELIENYPMHNRSIPYEMIQDMNDLQGSYLQILHEATGRLLQAHNKTVPIQIAERIQQAKEVAIYTFDVPTLCVEHLQYDLIMGGKQTRLYAAAEEKVEHTARLNRDSFVLIFCGRTVPIRAVMHCLQCIRETGAGSALITTLHEPALKTLADLEIIIPSSTFAVEMVYYHIFLTFITMEYRTRYLDHADAQT